MNTSLSNRKSLFKIILILFCSVLLYQPVLNDGWDGAGVVVAGSVDSTAETDGIVVARFSSVGSVSDSGVLSVDTAPVCSLTSC